MGWYQISSQSLRRASSMETGFSAVPGEPEKRRDSLSLAVISSPDHSWKTGQL